MSCVSSAREGTPTSASGSPASMTRNCAFRVATLFEKRRGAEMLKRRDPGRAAAIIRGIANLEKAFADRILPVDAPVVEEWTRLLGAKNKDRWDLALAATARVHRLVLVTRVTSKISRAAVRGCSIRSPIPRSGSSPRTGCRPKTASHVSRNRFSCSSWSLPAGCRSRY